MFEQYKVSLTITIMGQENTKIICCIAILDCFVT